MTRGLRRRHLLVMAMLAILLPVAFLLALALRRPPPVETSLPLPLAAEQGR